MSVCKCTSARVCGCADEKPIHGGFVVAGGGVSDGSGECGAQGGGELGAPSAFLDFIRGRGVEDRKFLPLPLAANTPCAHRPCAHRPLAANTPIQRAWILFEEES